jgi:hypothetical protein
MEQYYIIPKTTIDDIEDSIQRKRGSEAPIEPSEMPLAIDTIPSSVDGTDVPVGGIYLTKPDSNGNPTEVYIIGYAPATDYTWTDMLAVNYFPYLQKIEFINTNNVTTIIANAFRDNSSLTTINLPNSLININNQAFFGCTSLTTINLSNSLAYVSAYAFNGCSSLENVTIESGFNCNNLNLSASTKYSVETMVSWFNALADRTGQTPFTLTIGATNLNKLTAEQKAIATNKNWTLA